MNVLIADDSGVIRSIIRRALTELGVACFDEASSGTQAIEMVENEKYDLIITDWNMPGANGLSVIKASRAAGQTCPIVMQTTEAYRSYVMEAIAAGVNDYVLKPFNKDEIAARLTKYVNAYQT